MSGSKWRLTRRASGSYLQATSNTKEEEETEDLCPVRCRAPVLFPAVPYLLALVVRALPHVFPPRATSIGELGLDVFSSVPGRTLQLSARPLLVSFGPRIF